MISVRRNRAKTFTTALEVLCDATNELIEHLKFDIEDKTTEEIDAFVEKHGSLEEVLDAFDDALEYLPDERAGYIVEAEVGNDRELLVSFKERKE